MSENNNIDDIFKKGLGNYQQEPSEKLWLNIEKKLLLKKVLKLSLSIFLGVGLIIIATLISVRLDHKKQQDAQLITNQEHKTTSDVNNNLKKSDNSGTAQIPSVSENKNTSNYSEKETTQNSSIKKTTTSLSDTKNDLTAKTKNTTGVVNQKKVKGNDTHQKVEKLNDNNNPITSKDESLSKSSSLTDKQSLDEAQKIVDKGTVKNTEVSQAGIDNTKNQNATNDTKNQAVTNETKNQTQTEVVKTKAEENKNEVSNTNKSKITAPEDIKIIEPLKPAYEIMFYVMPSYASKTLSGLTQQEINFIKTNEKAQMFLNYGLEFRYRFSNFTIQTGLIETTSGEKNSYDYNKLKNVDTTGSHNNIQLVSYIDPQNSNNTIVTFDSTWIKEADSTFAAVKLSNINRIKYFEIPLNIGYVFNINKHQFGINGGVSCALLSKVSVSIYDNATEKIRQITMNDNMFKRTMWSYNVALSYSYLIDGNTSVFIQSGFRKNINSVFSNSSTQQRYQFFDTKIGVMVKL